MKRDAWYFDNDGEDIVVKINAGSIRIPAEFAQQFSNTLLKVAKNRPQTVEN